MATVAPLKHGGRCCLTTFITNSLKLEDKQENALIKIGFKAFHCKDSKNIIYKRIFTKIVFFNTHLGSHLPRQSF